MSDKPEAMTDLAQRIGTLFVLAMQTNDADLRDAASVSPTELGFTDGPSFLPVARLLKEREELRAALEGVLADIRDYERINNLLPNPGREDCWQSVTRARATLLTLKSKD